MAVRSVHDQYVDARVDQRVDAIVGIRARADCRSDAQRAGRVLAGMWEVLGFLEILGRDHALEFEAVTDDQHLFDAVLVQQPEYLFLGRALAHRDQPVLRRHDGRDRRVELGFKAQVAVRHDTDRLLAVDDRHARNAHGTGQVDDLTNRHAGRHRDRIAHHAGLEFLDRQDLPRLLLDVHILVDDTESALLGQRDRQSGLRDRIHGSRQDRDAEPNLPGQAGAQIDFPRQDLGVTRLQQDVIECEGFLGDTHGRMSGSG